MSTNMVNLELGVDADENQKPKMVEYMYSCKKQFHKHNKNAESICSTIITSAHFK